MYLSRATKVLILFSFVIFSVKGKDLDRKKTNTEVSLEELLNSQPFHFHRVFDALNLDLEELSLVKNALQNQDSIVAAREVIHYYQNSTKSAWLTDFEFELKGEELMSQANSLLNNTIELKGSSATIPLTQSGGWDWNYTGPDNDDEFGYSLNRHIYFSSLMYAWQKTKNDKYAACFNRIVGDWILHNPLPTLSDTMYHVFTNPLLDWRDIGEVVWRDLEAGRRLESSWPRAFYWFQNSDAFTASSRFLMLSSLLEHASYLQAYHKKGHNWTTMEMNGLALFALAFPEFKKSEEWANYAMQVMEGEINKQVYPDGIQTEISSKTQWVALKPFETIASNFEKGGKQVNVSYTNRLIDMYNYLAYSMRPDGFQVLNNDSDRDDLRPIILPAADKYKRLDWLYIATNGQEGIKPAGLATKVFPWAGINVMRNNWSVDAHWLVFDIGPFGTGHQHADMLHVSFAAFGKDILVDGGRFTHKDYFSFDPTIWRGYFRSSFSHNTILVDGKGQKGGPLRAAQPLEEGVDFINTSTYDFARGTFNSGYEDVEGIVKHSRSVLYLHDKYALVLDQIEANKPRKIETLWHFAPGNSMEVLKNQSTNTQKENIHFQLIPIGVKNAKVEIVNGRVKPTIQGWYSSEYGVKVPNNTAVYTQESQTETTNLWLLAPSKNELISLSAKLISLNTDYAVVEIIPGKKRIQMPLKKGLMPILE